MPQQVPPPYANITGVTRAVMKFNAQESFANYDGNARPGELVVNTADYSLYIGNADGSLNSVGGGGNGSPGGANLAVQYNQAGNFGGEAAFTYNYTTNTLNVGNVNITANAYIPNLVETTTGTSPVLLWDDGGNGTVGYDSTIYYDHNTETLNIGNIAFSDTPADTGVAISTTGSAGAGTLFFNINGNSVISFTDDRRVKYALLTYANIPNAAAGSMIYNNDTANTANGFYVCNDGTVTQVWEKVITSKNGVTYLVPQTSAPTAVAGGIYYDSTQKKFFMCANVSLGWQQVNLT